MPAREVRMAWKKNSPAAVARFDALAAVPGASRKVMFGCPVWEVNGERYAMLHQERVVLRLSADDTAKVLAAGGETWSPLPGRVSKDKVVLPDSWSADDAEVRRWLARAVAYAGV